MLCQKIEKGKLSKHYQNWGNVFQISFDIVVTRLPYSSWMNVFHFTATNRNCCGHGDRIPALYINRNGHFYFISLLNNNGNYYRAVKFELGVTYHVTIQQSKSGDNFWYEILINGESKLKIENSNPKVFSTVRLYTSDPWHDSFTSDFGSVCNLKIQEAGILCFIQKIPLYGLPQYQKSGYLATGHRLQQL